MATSAAIARLMIDDHVRAVPVVDGNRGVVGIVTRRDLLGAIALDRHVAQVIAESVPGVAEVLGEVGKEGRAELGLRDRGEGGGQRRPRRDQAGADLPVLRQHRTYAPFLRLPLWEGLHPDPLQADRASVAAVHE